jgi:hypothetical protein
VATGGYLWLTQLSLHFIGHGYGPTILFEGFPVQNPVDEFSSYGFYQECGFWPSQFQEVIDNLILLPDNILHQRT